MEALPKWSEQTEWTQWSGRIEEQYEETGIFGQFTQPERRAFEKKLNDREHQFRAVLEGSPNGVVAVDVRTRTTVPNNASSQLTANAALR